MAERILAFSDWFIIGIYLAISLLLGIWFSKRAGKNTEEFFLSGRKLPWWIAGTAMVATTFAADTPLAVTELVAQNGISGNWLWWSMAFGGMMTVFFFAPLWRRAGILTDLEFTEIRYHGKPAAFLRGFRAVYLGLFMNCIIMGWVNKAMITIVGVVFPDMNPQLFILGSMAFVALYSSLSGQWGVAITDTFQFFFAMLGCIVLAWFALDHPSIGGIAGLKSQLVSSTFQLFPTIGDTTIIGVLGLSLAAFLTYIGVIWWSSWYPGAEPGGGGYIAQRMMSAKDEKHALLSTLWFTIAHYCLRPWPWILVALVSLVLYPNLPPDHQRDGFVLVMKEVLPSGWYGLMTAAFMAAYMSTIATHLNWGASYIVNDVYNRFINKTATSTELVWSSRLTTFVLMAISFVVTQYLDTISGAWKFILDCGAGIGLVLILRWYWWRLNAWSEITAMVAPLVAFSLFSIYYPLEFPYSTLVITGITTVSWLAVTFLTKPTDSDHLKAFYTKTYPSGPGWEKYRKELGMGGNGVPLLRLFKLWILGIGIVYGTLFASAEFIFSHIELAISYTAVVLFCSAMLKWDYEKFGWDFIKD